MKYLKLSRSAAGAAVLASVTTAEAQTRRAVPRPAGPMTAAPRTAVPRANWRQFEAGVDTGDRNFQVGVFYSGGIPFYGGFPGYFYSNFWFPLWCGPRPLFRSEIEYLQLGNLPQPGQMTIWEARAWRNGLMTPGYVPGPDGRYVLQPQADQEKDELRRQLTEKDRIIKQYEIGNAERRGYERGLQERRPVPLPQQPQIQRPHEPAQPQPPQVQEEKFKVKSEYSGSVDKLQYTGVAKDFYNYGLFEGLRKVTDGYTNLVAYIESATKIGVRDANNKMTHLADIELRDYTNCINVDDLYDRFTAEIISRIKIDEAKVYSARAFVEIEKNNNYSASTCRAR